MRLEAKMALCGATKRNRHDQSIDHYRFPISVSYIAIVQLLSFASHIDSYCFKIRPEAEMGLYDAT